MNTFRIGIAVFLGLGIQVVPLLGQEPLDPPFELDLQFEFGFEPEPEPDSDSEPQPEAPPVLSDMTDEELEVSFSPRLRKAAAAEERIARELVLAIDRLVGLTSEELDEESRQLIEELSQLQTRTAADLEVLMNDLSSYLERVENEAGKEIRDEMRTRNFAAAVRTHSRALAANQSYRGIQKARKWSLQLNEWAERLSPEDKEDPERKEQAKSELSGREGLE